MKIRIHSDLHLEFAGWRPPPCDEDVVVLAGDIAEGCSGIAWAPVEDAYIRYCAVGSIREVIQKVRRGE